MSLPDCAPSDVELQAGAVAALAATLPPPAPGLRCTVVVPARNEAALLPTALQALASQSDAKAIYEVLVLANNCSDDTAEIARAFAAACNVCPIHVMEVRWPPEMANVGNARRLLMELAAQRVQSRQPCGGIVASTDGDTRVAPDWVAQTVSAVDAGADAVGGRILPWVDPALPMATRRLMRLDDEFRGWRARLESIRDPDPADPWPRHHQHFGASLALTTHALARIGGVPRVPFLEDEAIVAALRLNDCSVRHAPGVRVTTSPRLDGRAEVGLSWQLRQWTSQCTSGELPRVLDPFVEGLRWSQRRRARQLWQQRTAHAHGRSPSARSLPALASSLELDSEWLARTAAESPTFGRFWQAIEFERPIANAPLLPMDAAIARLRQLVARLRTHSLLASHAAAQAMRFSGDDSAS